jgi:K+-transporting ATPase ATPase B chain
VPRFVSASVKDALFKLDPRHLARNPVMFVTAAGSLLTTVLGIQALQGGGEAPAGFIMAVSAWLWATVLFSNFAEAVAERRGKAHAESLRRARRDIIAKRLAGLRRDASRKRCPPPPCERGTWCSSRPGKSFLPTAR